MSESRFPLFRDHTAEKKAPAEGPAGALGPPVDRLEIDVHADLPELLGRHHRLGMRDVRVGGIEEDDSETRFAAGVRELLIEPGSNGRVGTD